MGKLWYEILRRLKPEYEATRKEKAQEVTDWLRGMEDRFVTLGTGLASK